MRKTLAILLIGGLLAVACGPSRVELLSERVDAYNRSIRWSSLSAASALIDNAVRKTLLERLAKELTANKVVDYSIMDLGLDEKSRSGSVLVEYSYYGYDQELKYRQEVQSWKYSPKEKNWFLTAVRAMDVPSP